MFNYIINEYIIIIVGLIYGAFLSKFIKLLKSKDDVDTKQILRMIMGLYVMVGVKH